MYVSAVYMQSTKRLKPSFQYGGGVPQGGTEHAGHAYWEATITPFQASSSYPSPPPQPSLYARPVVINLPSIVTRPYGPQRGKKTLEQLLKGIAAAPGPVAPPVVGPPSDPPGPSTPPNAPEIAPGEELPDLMPQTPELEDDDITVRESNQGRLYIEDTPTMLPPNLPSPREPPRIDEPRPVSRNLTSTATPAYAPEVNSGANTSPAKYNVDPISVPNDLATATTFGFTRKHVMPEPPNTPAVFSGATITNEQIAEIARKDAIRVINLQRRNKELEDEARRITSNVFNGVAGTASNTLGVVSNVGSGALAIVTGITESLVGNATYNTSMLAAAFPSWFVNQLQNGYVRTMDAARIVMALAQAGTEAGQQYLTAQNDEWTQLQIDQRRVYLPITAPPVEYVTQIPVVEEAPPGAIETRTVGAIENGRTTQQIEARNEDDRYEEMRNLANVYVASLKNDQMNDSRRERLFDSAAKAIADAMNNMPNDDNVVRLRTLKKTLYKAREKHIGKKIHNTRSRR